MIASAVCLVSLSVRGLICAALLWAFSDELTLTQRFAAARRIAIIDPYQRRSKTSRDFPRKKQERLAGQPAIHTATKPQVRLARQLADDARKGLTA